MLIAVFITEMVILHKYVYLLLLLLLCFKQLAPHKATAWLATQFCLSLKIKTSTILEYVEMNILMFLLNKNIRISFCPSG